VNSPATGEVKISLWLILKFLIHRHLQEEDDEVDFLKLILRCAVALRRLILTISDDVSPSDNGFEKICRTMKEYPDVE
jgi:hypothetical protein